MTFAQKLRIGMEIADVRIKEMSLDLNIYHNNLSAYRTGYWSPSQKRKEEMMAYLESRRKGTLMHLERIEMDEPAD